MAEIKVGIAPAIRCEISRLENMMMTPAGAVSDITDAPTKEDFNGLLAKLREAGIISAE